MAGKYRFLVKKGWGWFRGGADVGGGWRAFRKGPAGGVPVPPGPAIQFNAALTNTLVPTVAVDPTYTFSRGDTDATVTDFEGVIRNVTANEARFVGARRVHNLATGLVTETITVIVGNDYQVTIAGTNGATAVASGAFTGTLTADGTNRISWPSGTPKTAVLTSLTLTVTGTLTEMLVEDVTGQANQNPSENIVIGAEHGSGVGDVKYFTSQNGNTVDVSGVVTESPGADIAAATLEGVLVEDQATNLIQYSEDITTDGAGNPWGTTTTVITANDAVAPSGVSTADRVDDDASTGLHTVFHNIQTNVVNGVIYSLCGFFKAAEYQDVVIRAGGASFPATRAEVRFTLTGNGTSVIFGGSPLDHGIELIGNGWYRCWMTVSAISTGTGALTFVLHNGTSSSYAGVPGNGILAWGFQVEASTYPTTYIPSLGAAATSRNQEALFYANTNIANTEGTLAFSFTPDGNSVGYINSGDRALVGVRGTNEDLLYIDNSSGKTAVADGTSTTNITAMPALVAGTVVKLAARWSATTSLMDIGQDTTENQAAFDGSMNKSTALRLGYSGANSANGSIKLLRVYNGAVDDATFTSLTS